MIGAVDSLLKDSELNSRAMLPVWAAKGQERKRRNVPNSKIDTLVSDLHIHLRNMLILLAVLPVAGFETCLCVLVLSSPRNKELK